MLVELKPNRNNPEERIAFVQVETLHGRCSFPCFFSRKAPQPTIVGEADVMITGMILPKDENGFFMYHGKPKCFFIELVNPSKYVKVQYDGFAIEGSMATTSSRATRLDTLSQLTITPGRMQHFLPVVDMMNDDGPYQALKPGIGYIDQHPEKIDRWRLSAVDNFESLNLMGEYEHVA